MKKILLFIVLTLTIYAQNDVKVYGKLVVVKDGNEPIISDYIDSARIESPHQIIVKDNLGQVSPSDVLPLPEVGELCVKDKLYSYNGQVIICLQTHNRTIFRPEDTPNLFNFYRSGTDLEWQINELVAKGDIRIYNGVKYECLMGHTCIMTWTPPATLGILWKVVPTTSEWTAGVAYKVGDIVTYQGNKYQCLQGHTSIITWTPTATLNVLWKKI